MQVRLLVQDFVTEKKFDTGPLIAGTRYFSSRDDEGVGAFMHVPHRLLACSSQVKFF